jgi:histidine ammonia-lyase
MEYLILDGQSLTLEKLICAIRDGKKVMLSETAEVKVVQARQAIENALQSKRVIYGNLSRQPTTTILPILIASGLPV